MEYRKIELIKEWLLQYYSIYALTVDTDRYVDDEMNDKIMNKIFRFQKKDFKKVIKEAKIYEKFVKKNQNRLIKIEKKNVKNKRVSLIAKLKVLKKNRALKKRLWGFRRARMLGKKVDYN